MLNSVTYRMFILHVQQLSLKGNIECIVNLSQESAPNRGYLLNPLMLRHG